MLMFIRSAFAPSDADFVRGELTLRPFSFGGAGGSFYEFR